MLTITLEDLQSRFIRLLANQCFVRYSIYWDGTDGTRMALRCQDNEGNHIQVQDLLDAGFEIETRDDLAYYVCRRKSEKACVCQDPAEVFFSGVSGVLRGTNGVIERCDACERFDSDASAVKAYQAHVPFMP